MSPVLRPGRVTSKVNEGIINNSEIVAHTEEVLPVPSSIVEPVVSIALEEVLSTPSPLEEISMPSEPNEILPVSQEEEVHQEIKAEEEIKEQEEEKKEEKISAVLQELLDRKISKAIEGAEASLATSQPEISTESSLPVPNVGTELVSEVSVPMPLPVSEPVAAPIPTPASQEVLPILGQEIHISTPVVNVLPSTLVVEESLTVAPPSTLPSVEKGNMIPINTVPQEVVVAPVIPVEAVAITTNVPVVAAVTEPTVHWFDKLFGSAPKTPPAQSA